MIVYAAIIKKRQRVGNGERFMRLQVMVPALLQVVVLFPCTSQSILQAQLVKLVKTRRM
jgi:hypothetical protein